MVAKIRREFSPFIAQIFGYLIDYIRYLPLTFIVLYCFTLLLALVIDTPVESIFIRILLLSLGIKEASASLNGDDIMRGFTIWWLILGTIFQVLSKIFHIRFNLIFVAILGLVVIMGNITLALKMGSITVPAILFVFFLIASLAYFALSGGFHKFFSLGVKE